VSVTNRESTTVGGRDAVRFDVELAPDAECNGGGFCVGFATARLVHNVTFEEDNTYRVYWVVGGDLEPIAIWIGISTGGDEFLASADELVASLVIGEPGPHPIPEGNLWELGIGGSVPAGPVMVPAHGGLSFELSERLFMEQPDDNVLILFLDGPGEVNVLEIVADGQDNPIDSVDEVVAVFESTGGMVTELDPVEIAGNTARVFDLVDTPEPNFALGPVLKDMVGGENGWFPPNRGRFRVFESERGLIMIGSESFEDDSFIDQAIEIGDLLASTLEFIDFSAPE
jgi:hypothetical protein